MLSEEEKKVVKQVRSFFDIDPQLTRVILSGEVQEADKIVSRVGREKVYEKYLLVVKSRNELALARGFDTYVELKASDYKIDMEKVRLFASRPKEIAFISGKNVISSLEGIFELFFRINPEIGEKIKEKVKIAERDVGSSYCEYDLHQDRYLVVIAPDKSSKFYLTDLIHEISHIVSSLDKRHDGKYWELSKFSKEYFAYLNEINFLVHCSGELVSTKTETWNNLFEMVDFEILIHKHPNEIPYDSKCLLSESTIMRPLDKLAHAVALYEALFKTGHLG